MKKISQNIVIKDTKVMKLVIRDRLNGLLSGSEVEQSDSPIVSDPEAKAELKLRIQQALAATRLEDMNFPRSVRLLSKSERRYQLELQFKWKWPIPVALELRIIDEDIWEIDLVSEECK